MTQPLELWNNRYRSLQRSVRVGQMALTKGSAYVFRVGHTHFETAFAGYLAQPGDDWQNLLQEALRLFALSAQSEDCRSKEEYPFNLAQLYSEWYLGQWLLGHQPDSGLLDQSINTYVDALAGQEPQPLSAFAVLPMGYLLAHDHNHLANFWRVLAERAGPGSLPSELAFWYKCSELLQGASQLESEMRNGYLQAYAAYCNDVSDPTDESAKFYLAVTKIGIEMFSLQGDLRSTILSMAVEPWRR